MGSIAIEEFTGERMNVPSLLAKTVIWDAAARFASLISILAPSFFEAPAT